MKKHIVNEATGISYTLVGDYYIPDLKLPETENKPIGIWGRKRLTYLKEYKKISSFSAVNSTTTLPKLTNRQPKCSTDSPSKWQRPKVSQKS